MKLIISPNRNHILATTEIERDSVSVNPTETKLKTSTASLTPKPPGEIKLNIPRVAAKEKNNPIYKGAGDSNKAATNR